MKNFLKNRELLIIILFTLIGGFLRFYNLNWGSPFYFHPDERNIASSVSQLYFPSQMNPHFFAYGSFPIYIIYFFGIAWNIISSLKPLFLPHTVSFENAILISRFLSGLLSSLLIPFIYLVGKRLKDQNTGFIAALFATLSVGFIQFAHFGTFEILTSFLGLLLFYFCIRITEKGDLKEIIFTSILLGLLIATKIPNIVFILLPLISVFIYSFHEKQNNHLSIQRIFFLVLKKSVVVIFFTAVVFIITSPFILLDFSSFRSSFQYESSVALGTLPVFYTQEFYVAISVIFQLTQIYPFLLNPLLTLISIPSIIFIAYKAFKRNNGAYYLVGVYFLVFISQAFLFAKWTRYIVVTLPFLYLIISILLSNFSSYAKKYVLMAIIFISVVFTVSYFITVYIKPDTRVSASFWAKGSLPSNAKILSEAYDLGITAFNPYFSNIALFNFYDEAVPILNNYDYIILPSQRLMKIRVKNKTKFPSGHKFYTLLLEGKLGYEKIYETPCDIFCKITYLGNPVFSFEETASVFDRPTVFIFKKYE